MNKQTQELLSKIMALAYEVNEKTTTDVFVRLAGHVKTIDITWHINGWSKYSYPSSIDGSCINGTINLDNIKMLNKAADTLEELLK